MSKYQIRQILLGNYNPQCDDALEYKNIIAHANGVTFHGNYHLLVSTFCDIFLFVKH